MIYNIQLIIQFYFYLHYFHGVYVALSFLRFVIQNIYNGSCYILKIFEKKELKQIKDIQFESNEIENDFILLKLLK
tara:strand:- start:2350 stop:2577 length:228 start_codon:yes stop_codon:yes gene_type:complete